MAGLLSSNAVETPLLFPLTSRDEQINVVMVPILNRLEPARPVKAKTPGSESGHLVALVYYL